MKVGDKVKVINAYINKEVIGKVMTVTRVNGSNVYLGDIGTPWTIPTSFLKLVESRHESKDMKSLTIMAKKLLDPDTKTLIKAGFVTDSLELSDDGDDALKTMLFLKYRDEMVKEAKAKIKESKKKCDE